jgi:hypothetical protein
MKNIISIFLIVTASTISFAQTSSSDDKQVINTLRAFYTTYISEFAIADGGRQFEASLGGLRNKYSTAKFQKQYKRLVQKTDSDPIIQGQDSDAEFA